MIDDQDRCKRVNVTSGTGSRRQSRTKGHETVVVGLVFYSYSRFGRSCLAF